MEGQPGGETVLDALRELEADGFLAQFVLRAADTLQCSACGQTHRPDTIRILAEHRIEGESDPDDEAIVMGLECPCGAKGTEVFQFGPAATAEERQAFSEMVDARRRPP